MKLEKLSNKNIKVVEKIKSYKKNEARKQIKDILESETRQFYVNKKGLVLTKKDK